MKLDYLTERELCRIYTENPDKIVEIMTSCMDRSGLMTKSKFSEITGMKKRTVERQCLNGKIPTDPYFKMPMINVWLKNRIY